MAEATKEQMTQLEKEKEDLFINLNRQSQGLVDQLEKALLALEPKTATGQLATQVAGATPAQKAIQGSLPWFKHGMRGFLRKLWYGDHPTNPDWKHVAGVYESINKRITLREYIEIQEGIEQAVDEFFTEATSVQSLPDAIQSYFIKFKTDLAATIHYYTNQMYDLGKKHANTNASISAKAPEAQVDKPTGMGAIDRNAPIHPEPEVSHAPTPLPPPQHEPEAQHEPSDNPFEDESEAEPLPGEGEESRASRIRDLPTNHRGDAILGVQAATDFNPWEPKYGADEVESPKVPRKKGRPRGTGEADKASDPVFNKILRKSGSDLLLKRHLSPEDLETTLIHLHRQGVDLQDIRSVKDVLYRATGGKYDDTGALVRKYAELQGMDRTHAYEYIKSRAEEQQESRKWTMSNVQRMLLEQSLAQSNKLPLPEKIAFYKNLLKSTTHTTGNV